MTQMTQMAPRITVNHLESHYHPSAPVMTFLERENEQEYSTQSLSHDSGHGSSEQEESPRFHLTGGSLRAGSARNLCHGIRSWRQTDDWRAETGQGWPRGVYGAARATSPWNHTYSEIDGKRVFDGQDPVYAEIDHEHEQQLILGGLHPHHQALLMHRQQQQQAGVDFGRQIHDPNLIATIRNAMKSPSPHKRTGMRQSLKLSPGIVPSTMSEHASRSNTPSALSDAEKLALANDHAITSSPMHRINVIDTLVSQI
ncbi:unnamed protein product [Notodromas monacha]|uniref:Uncharacterized protein n=1 Tax=Notodromas monacha TaxID=399045 RepID=A0A7R9C1G0_9CRUS|nr:unnamed protein product [Notodromas monacha]CAG0924293.1 unnamed protein product [Notodromas monacha]